MAVSSQLRELWFIMYMLLGVMRTYSTSIATAYGDTYKMEYVCQRVMHSWVVMFQHIEAPRDYIDVSELSLP